jgi:polyribonucleotide nucleotidyltransferase
LGIKQCFESPWKNFSDTHKIGDIIEGEIRNIADFGLFVGLDKDIDGMVHLSDLFNPRISPKDAPELEEPYCATASFSSAISRDLMEREIFRAERSIFVTLASILSPSEKRSGRCSERSRLKSTLRMKVLRP